MVSGSLFRLATVLGAGWLFPNGDLQSMNGAPCSVCGLFSLQFVAGFCLLECLAEEYYIGAASKFCQFAVEMAGCMNITWFACRDAKEMASLVSGRFVNAGCVLTTGMPQFGFVTFVVVLRGTNTDLCNCYLLGTPVVGNGATASVTVSATDPGEKRFYRIQALPK